MRVLITVLLLGLISGPAFAGERERWESKSKSEVASTVIQGDDFDDFPVATALAVSACGGALQTRDMGVSIAGLNQLCGFALVHDAFSGACAAGDMPACETARAARQAMWEHVFEGRGSAVGRIRNFVRSQLPFGRIVSWIF